MRASTRFVNKVPERLQYVNWRVLPICVWDVETTGLNIYEKDFRIVQFCGKIFIENKQVKCLNILIDPEIEIPEVSSKIHGIYNNDVKGRPNFDQVSDTLNEFLGSASVHCAYNGLGLDADAMNSEFIRVGKKFIFRPMIDPLVWEREWRKKFKGNTLSAVAKRRGCSVMGKVMRGEGGRLHDAEVDVDILQSVLKSQSEDLPYTLGRLIEKQNEFKIRQDEYAIKQFGNS